ncbi:hypothetical protein [Paenibacillus caui]|uniref:hypothetical protein n=1 Tax=Paenibacillus caui TaxID=2873927 RepID=UPI001CA89A55|nr:hypothetical protein [Paenibacillus caui]
MSRVIESEVWDGIKNESMDEINALIGPSLGKSPTAKKPESLADPDAIAGRFINYNGDRGFGFVRSQEHGDIFFHIGSSPDFDPDVLRRGYASRS